MMFFGDNTRFVLEPRPDAWVRAFEESMLGWLNMVTLGVSDPLVFLLTIQNRVLDRRPSGHFDYAGWNP